MMEKESDKSMGIAISLFPCNAQMWHYGFAKGLDIAVGFGTWINSNPDIEKCDRGFRYKGVHPYSSSELLQLYLGTLKTK